jgi:hypothetical protein
MLTVKDIQLVIIPDQDISLIVSNAKKAEIGGISRIRKQDRLAYISEDQLVGQISTYCASLFLTGSIEGYIKARDKANSNPLIGDNGIDICGLDNVDIKGSLMRYSENPFNYRLLVREQERHPNWIYILGLVPKKRPYQCYLVGWAKDSDLPKDTYKGDIRSLHGAFVIEAKQLRPLQLIRILTK